MEKSSFAPKKGGKPPRLPISRESPACADSIIDAVFA
jgi:hypothetical protein